MNKTLIINTHEPYSFSEGKLSQSLVDLMENELKNLGHEVRVTTVKEFDVEEEIAKHLWADNIIVQVPVNWMGVPWTYKRYTDIVYTAACDGRFVVDDGRTRDNPDLNYGTGGSLKNKKYMLSLTFNAPKSAFDKQDEFLFQGKSVDDLFFPVHMTFKFCAMEKIKTFSCFDVIKNPSIENDMKKLKKHINEVFA